MKRTSCAWLLLACLMAGCGERVPTYAIATGGPAGLYYPYGGGMASVWSKELPHLNARAEVTGGSVTNVIQVARRESELGIAMADVVTEQLEPLGELMLGLPWAPSLAAADSLALLAHHGGDREAEAHWRQVASEVYERLEAPALAAHLGRF